MSVLDEVMKEIYPHTVEVRRLVDRHEITKWCADNDIHEHDISLLFEQGMKIGWTIRLVHMDEWLLAKLRWT
jgi:hypothetical protein